MILRAGLVGRSCLARACQRRSKIPIIHPLLPPPPISQTSRLLPSQQLLGRDALLTTTARYSFQNDDSDAVPPWPEGQKEDNCLEKTDSHMNPDETEQIVKPSSDPTNISETHSPPSTNNNGHPPEEPDQEALSPRPEEINSNHANTNDSYMTAEEPIESVADAVERLIYAVDPDNLVPQVEPYLHAARGGKLAWGEGQRGSWLESWEQRFRPLYRALNSGRAFSRALAEVSDFPQWGESDMLFSAEEIQMQEFQERYCGYGNVDEYLTKWMDSMLYLLRYDTALAHRFLRATYEGTLTPRWAVNDTVEFLARWCAMSPERSKIKHELAEVIRHILQSRMLYTLEFTQHTLFLITRDMEAEALWGLYWGLVQYGHPLHPYTWYTIARRLSRDPRYKSHALDMLEEAITSGELHGDAPLTMMLSTCILDFQDVPDGHLEQMGQLRGDLTTRLLNLITPNKYTYSVMVRGMRATGDYQGAWTIYQIMLDQGIEPEQFIFSNLLNVAKRTNTIEPVLQTLEELVPEALKSRYIWNDIIDCVLVISRQHDLQLKDEAQRNAHAVLTFRALLLVYARFYRYKDLQALIPVRLGPPYQTAEEVFATATTEMDVSFLRKIDRILERLPERVEQPAVPGSDAISIMLRGYARAVWKAGEVVNFYKLFRAKLMQGQYTVCQICREQDSRVHDAILGSLLKIPKWNNVAWSSAQDSRRSVESRDALQAGFGILEDMIEGAMCAEKVLKEEAEEELLAKREADELPADQQSVRTLRSVLPDQEHAPPVEAEPSLIEQEDHPPFEEHISIGEEHLPAEEEYLPPLEDDPPPIDGELLPAEGEAPIQEPLPTTIQQQQQPPEPPSSPPPPQQHPPLNPTLLTPLHPPPRPGSGWPSLKAQQAQWAAFHHSETYLYSMSPAPTIYTFNVLLSGVIRASRSLTSAKACIKQAQDWLRYLADHNLEPNYHTWSILVRNWSRQQRPGAVAWAMKKMEEAGFKANEKMMEELELLRDKEQAWRELERLMDEELRGGRGGERGDEREEGWERLGRIVREQEERRRQLEMELEVEGEFYPSEIFDGGDNVRGGKKEEEEGGDWDNFVRRVEEDRRVEEGERKKGGKKATF
ncbi:hypothetical protein QBC40DRAFT_224979 [Triangularia verruculosa]|uniref:Pentatricopeptide repeat protein n=1 Tax=Triangularia verruculosa TaxID=2587418 RepID=A0AAN6XI40_9PEZI|nr:hypothetical protein QBC40DRAFT_224979 [Triangularia verruculosa]